MQRARKSWPSACARASNRFTSRDSEGSAPRSASRPFPYTARLEQNWSRPRTPRYTERNALDEIGFAFLRQWARMAHRFFLLTIHCSTFSSRTCDQAWNSFLIQLQSRAGRYGTGTFATDYALNLRSRILKREKRPQ